MCCSMVLASVSLEDDLLDLVGLSLNGPHGAVRRALALLGVCRRHGRALQYLFGFILQMMALCYCNIAYLVLLVRFVLVV